ncbi:MAG: alpha/beta hydrolase [Holophagae bacterium]|nr:alpha/beta hydrolase [Holophagae bacterium]
MKRYGMTILVTILGAYVVMTLYLFLVQDSMIFFPPKLTEQSPQVIGYKALETTFDIDGVVLRGWLLNPGKRKLIIYYGGNAEEVSLNMGDFKRLTDYSVLLLNYRGYGMSDGHPGQTVLLGDALRVFDEITDEMNIFPADVLLFGRSLGSSVAAYVAGKRGVSKLILVTPFDSLRGVAKAHFRFFPVGLLMRHPFDSLSSAEHVQCRPLVLIAGNDEIIPKENSMNLVHAFKGNCTAIVVKFADHNSIHMFPEYWLSIEKYLICEKPEGT